MSGSDGERPQIRIGNAEREAAYRALDTHLEDGRLDADEYGERYARASVARTREDIRVLFDDLPPPHPLATGPQPSWAAIDARPLPRPGRLIGRLLLGAAITVLLVVTLPLLAVGALLWFVVLPLATGGGCRRHWAARRGWYGPAWRTIPR